MNCITIDNDGQSWFICIPTNQADLDNFLALSKKHETGTGFACRTASSAEAIKCTAAHAYHIFKGGQPHEFFGLPA